VLAIFDSVHHYPGRWIQLKKITIDFRHTKKDKYNSTKKKKSVVIIPKGNAP
jgi:hypothetical protein